MQCKDITHQYQTKPIFEGLSLSIPDQKITTLIGCNGSGKSTLLKILSRILKPDHGSVYLNGKDIHQTPSKEVAKILSTLPQNPQAAHDITVEQLVTHGRFPSQSFFKGMTRNDKEIIEWALSATGMTEFSKSSISHLSGGQRQRAWISMALAQGGNYLFLDEPTTYLDIHHQLEILLILKKLNEEKKKTILMVLHDINHASRFSHHIIAIDKGIVIKEGTPKNVLQQNLIQSVFRVSAHIYMHAQEDYPILIPRDLIHV